MLLLYLMLDPSAVTVSCCNIYRKKECKNSNNLDLHGLHVSEAVDLVHKMIYYRKSGMCYETRRI